MSRNPKTRCAILEEGVALIKCGAAPAAAWREVAIKHGVNRATVYRWFALVQHLPRAEWDDVLKPKQVATKHLADFTPAALEYLVKTYKAMQPPSLPEAYRDLLGRAKIEGWKVPALRTVERRLKQAGVGRRTRYDGL